MITSTIALFAALTLVGPTSKVNGYFFQSSGLLPDSNHVRTKPTSEFHSKLVELGVDIYHVLHDHPAFWTNITVISSNKVEHFVRENAIQHAVSESIRRIAGEVEKQLSEIDGTKDKIPTDECALKMLKYGEEHMYIYESLRYQADLLIGLEVIDETIPPWSGTTEEQAARDEIFTILETWSPSFHRKEWKRD